MTQIPARKAIETLLMAVTLVSCSDKQRSLPENIVSEGSSATILPNYADVTVPPNIAPLNFSVMGDTIDDCVAHFSSKAGSFCYGKGHKVQIDERDWKRMLEANRNDSIDVELYTHSTEGWRKHESFSIHISADSIDPYIAYRRIPPYNTYERISLCQRNLETFDEVEYYNNRMLSTKRSGHCVNCHAFQNYHTERMQFHVREEFAGTMIAECPGGNTDKKLIKKVNMKLPETISSGVYPAWHPRLNLIAYSVNKSFMDNHTYGLTKSEVQDSESGLILYDNDHNKVIPICNEPDTLETFPAWSPDGKYLYYAAAHFIFHEKESSATSKEARINRQHEVLENYREVRYNIYRRPFDSISLSFGNSELVLNSSADSLSATLPRISPDGQWLLTCIGSYGCFHIYHPEADLYVTSTTTGETHSLAQANSERAESYHNWSSTGRWIVFQSRRRDNNYTRLYFTHFNADGTATKAFELPQEDPDYELINLNSYNIPEFTTEPVRIEPDEWASAIQEL